MATIYSTPTTVAVVSGIDPASDWAARSTASGVTYAENWSTFATAAAYYSYWNTGGMMGYTCPKNPGMGSTWTNAYDVVTDSTHAKTGKAFRLYHGKNNYGDPGTIDNQWFNVLLNGNPNNVSGAFKTSFYVQVSVWVDEYIDYYWRLGDGGVGGQKFFRLDDQRATNIGEIVVQSQHNLGFVTAYRREANGNNTLFDRSQYTQLYTPNFAHQPAINNPIPANPVTEAEFRQKFGPMNYGMTSGTSQSTPLHLQNTPDPDAAIGGVPFKRGGITVIEVWVDLATQSLKLWAAPYGGPPKLLINASGTCNFGNRVMADGVGWNCFEFTNLIYTADGAHNPNYPISSIDYSELICSTNPIRFPGGYALPSV